MVLALIKRPITRSRNPDRIMIPNLQARNRSKDVLRRTMYLQHLVQNKPDEVDKYISSLHIRTIQRILKYLTSERRGESFNEVFTILRQSFLSKFPVPNVTSRKPPLLQIVGYTSAQADIVPLRALYNDPSLLVLLPQVELKILYALLSRLSTMVQRWIDFFLMVLMWVGITTSSLPASVTYRVGNRM